MKKVSVIIPVFNSELLINRCLDSVVNQAGNFDLEIICINDGSTDNSLNLLNNYNYPLVIINQKNRGQAAARNEGVNVSKGDFIAFLDADDYWLPNFLSRTISFLSSNEKLIAVNTGQLHKIFGVGQHYSPAFLEKTNLIKNKKPFIIDNFYKFWFEHNHVCTGSVVIRSKIVKAIGGQVEKFRISQDLEYWALLATYGKWGFIPEILFVSDGGIVTKKNGFLKKYFILSFSKFTLGIKAVIYFFLKRLPL